MSNWAVDLDTMIYSIFKTALTEKLGEKYPDMYITTLAKTPSTPKFPTIYFHPLSGVETGQTLVNDGINAVNYSVQIEVTVTESQQEARNISAEVLNVMKSLQFNVIAMPLMSEGEDTYITTSRFRRIIGANDII